MARLIAIGFAPATLTRLSSVTGPRHARGSETRAGTPTQALAERLEGGRVPRCLARAR
jgi:hypothetical protein